MDARKAKKDGTDQRGDKPDAQRPAEHSRRAARFQAAERRAKLDPSGLFGSLRVAKTEGESILASPEEIT
jgi:hypothetical protein